MQRFYQSQQLKITFQHYLISECFPCYVMRGMLLVALLSTPILSFSQSSESLLPFCQNSPDPVGGGAGYSQGISESEASLKFPGTWPNIMRVQALKVVIENANRGDVIWIMDEIEIDMTGYSSILIPAGVTIAGGRGINGSPGPLIKSRDVALYNYDTRTWTDRAKSDPVFRLAGDSIRITGIRFEGPFGGTGDRPITRQKYGIRTLGHEHFEIDNCEIYNWPRAGVSVENGSIDNIYIHHNHIHNCHQKAYGYGIVILDAYATIQNNLFHHNRHEIAGSGASYSGYEASCNTVLTGGIAHNFDMHGAGGDIGPHAGTFIHIHHNTFHDLGASREFSNNRHNIVIRGKPEIQCRVEHNVFAHPLVESAIRQRIYFGNLLVWNNIFGYDQYLGWYARPDWDKNRINNSVKLPSTGNDELMSSMHGDSEIDYAFGDFDGDGGTDIFKQDSGRWYILPLETGDNGLNTDWTRISTSATMVHTLYFDNFDADATTDVFRMNGTNWQVSYSGSSSWSNLISSGFVFSNTHRGDFDGNGVTDILRATGAEWRVSYGATSSWQTINSMSDEIDDFRVADFNGNGTSDLFKSDGTSWFVSYGGTTGWTSINGSGVAFSNLILADFNQDGISDVIRTNATIPQVSINGLGSWQNIETANFPIGQSLFGGF